MSTGENNPDGTGGASPRSDKAGRTSFAAVAKAAREREAKARKAEGEAPAAADAAPDAVAGVEPGAGAPATAAAAGATPSSVPTTVHVRNKGTDPFADSSEQRLMKPRAASRTIHVAVPPALGAPKARPVPVAEQEAAVAPPQEAPAAPAEPESGAAVPEPAVPGPDEGRPPAPEAGAVPAPSESEPPAPARKTGLKSPLRDVDIESRATATRTRMRAEDFKPQVSPTTIFFVVLGWVYALCGLIAVVWAGHKVSEFTAKAQKPVLEEKQKWEDRLKTEKDRLAEARSKVDAKANDAGEERRRLAAEIKALEDEVAKNEAKRKAIYQEMAQIQQDFKPTGQQATDTQGKLTQAKAEFSKQMVVRGKMWGHYNKRWDELSKGFWKAMQDPLPAQLSKFYDDNKHTVYGAAAAFYAAEKYYKADWRPRAKSLYQAVQKDFANSPYAPYAFERLQQLEAKADYKPGNYPAAPFARFELDPITDQEKAAKRQRDEDAAKRKAEEDRKKAEEEAKKAKGPP